MRIKALTLTWFRGAADAVSLLLDTKSQVVYGQNGSGKSSFVDAVEFVLNGGKIDHLAHEYSGKRQEKAIPNTHKPDNQNTSLVVTFQDDSELQIQIHGDGTFTSKGAETVGMQDWGYRCSVLRQDEVAAFIRGTKLEKYSALLPLLGLHSLEVTAENLRQLAKSVEDVAKLKEAKVELRLIGGKRVEAFGTLDDAAIVGQLDELSRIYCAGEAPAGTAPDRYGPVRAALDATIAGSTAELRRHVALRSVAEIDLKGKVGAVRAASVTLASDTEPLLAEKLGILQSTGDFVAKVADAREIACPACGRPIPVEEFRAHVRAEQDRLRGMIEAFEGRRAAIGALCDSVTSLRGTLRKGDVESWRDEMSRVGLAGSFAYLDGLDIEVLRGACADRELKAIEEKLLALIDAAADASKRAPADARQLAADKQAADTGMSVVQAQHMAARVARAEAVIAFVRQLERGTREEIRQRSKKVIGEITADIQAMWAILHPGEAIEGVQLVLPEATDKAIDIGLKFYGIEQASPRLTLSEGYRNSLGLCIFLSMAKRNAHEDRPLFLDDVVVSLDRNHRGMIAALLEKMFSERQVVILTHDRVWHAELRHQLDSKRWTFRSLLPYETPSVGIRWSHKTTTFDDARAHLKERPDSAGNDARKIMDVELALIAERLNVTLPYRRGDANDKRMAHEFLERLIADGKKCFQARDDKDFVCHQKAVDALREADGLLVAWGDRASHTFDLVRPEATKLIDACEGAIASFRCPKCERPVYFTDAETQKWVQCQCGQVRWRYGKA